MVCFNKMPKQPIEDFIGEIHFARREILLRKIFSVMLAVVLVIGFYTTAIAETEEKNEKTGYMLVIDDQAKLLKSSEIEQVKQAMVTVADYANAGFVTINKNDNRTPPATLARIWGEDQFGGGSARFTVFIIDMVTRHLDIYASKPIADILTSDELNKIADCVYLYATYGHYGKCAAETFRLTADVLKSSEFVFRGKIKWGMSEETVIMHEGEKYTKEEFNDFTKYYYSDVKVSKYQGSLEYGFSSGRLLFCTYWIEKPDQGMLEYMKTALGSVYGEAAEISEAEALEIKKNPVLGASDETGLRGLPKAKWNAAGDTGIIHS